MTVRFEGCTDLVYRAPVDPESIEAGDLQQKLPQSAKMQPRAFVELRLHLPLKAGEPIVEVLNKWHYGKNEGEKTAELLIFYAVVSNTPITIGK